MEISNQHQVAGCAPEEESHPPFFIESDSCEIASYYEVDDNDEQM